MAKHKLWWMLFIICAALLAACEAEPTPFPVDIALTPTPTPTPTAIPPVRYALAPNTIGYIADIQRLQDSGVVTQSEMGIDIAALGHDYDVAAAYGIMDGWLRSEVTPNVMLIINPQAPELDAALIQLIQRSIDITAVTAALNIPGVAALGQSAGTTAQETRTTLANLGKPDGLQLGLAYAYIPGANQIAEMLAQANIHTRIFPMSDEEILAAFQANRLHAALVTWIHATDRERWGSLFGEDFVMELYALPISYLAQAQLTVSFTPDGWPLARW